MKIIVLGADGYLGFPSALHFASAGHEVHAVDNLSKRYIEAQSCVSPLIHLKSYHQRFSDWLKTSPGSSITTHVIDIATQKMIELLLQED